MFQNSDCLIWTLLWKAQESFEKLGEGCFLCQVECESKVQSWVRRSKKQPQCFDTRYKIKREKDKERQGYYCLVGEDLSSSCHVDQRIQNPTPHECGGVQDCPALYDTGKLHWLCNMCIHVYICSYNIVVWNELKWM